MRRAGLLAVMLVLAGTSNAAAAPDTTVDFERVPAGVAVTTQYVSPEGVEFGDPTEFGLPEFGRSCGVIAQNGGIAGRSGQIACQAADAGDVTNPTLFNAAFEFRETRRKVGFQLRNSTPQNDGRTAAQVRFYGPGAVLLNEQTITFPSASATRDVVWEITGATRIAAVWIASVDAPERPVNNIPPVFVDNIYATKDDVPPSPAFALALQTPSVSVYEGATANATLSIRRFNGSTGNVNLSLTGGLPSGISGVQFVPNPVTGRDPVTMRISAASPFTGSRQLTVRAVGGSPDAGAAANADLTQTVVGSPVVSVGNRGAAMLVRGCGAQPVQDEFTVRGGYSGPVGVGPTGAATGPASIAVSTPTVAANGDGTYPFTFVLDPDGTPGSPGNGGTYNVSVQPAGATAVASSRSYTIGEVHADSASSPTGGAINRPMNVLGPRAVVTGDLPRQCEIRFVDQHGVEWPIVDRHTVEIGGRARDQVTLQVPVLATSGPLTIQSVKTGTALTTTPALDVVDFRNVFGSRATNSGANAGASDYSWEDFRRTFGNDDVDRCFLGMCGRDPVAEQYHQQYLASVRSNAGLCAGYVFMAMRFFGFDGVVQRPSDYEPGRARAYQITNFADGTQVKRDIVRWQVAQSDAGWAQARRDAMARGAQAELDLLRSVIRAGSVAAISIQRFNAATNTTSGHAVLAYAIEENVPAQAGEVAPVTRVRLYDPNLPYGTADETTPNATTPAAAAAAFVNARTLRIDANGSWSGASFPWSGPNNQLGVINAIPPANASLPTKSFLVFFALDSDAGSPALVGLEAAGKDALGKNGEPKPGSGVTVEPLASGVKAEPRYGLRPGRAYEASLRGTRNGKYVQGQYARGAVATVETRASRGQVDTLTIEPGSPELAFSTGAAKTDVEYHLAENVGKRGRGVKIATVARKSGEDKASLDGGAVNLVHSGPATSATLTLSTVGEGLPSTVTTAPIRVGARQRLQVKPTRWADLGAGASYVVRNRKGKVVKRGKVRLRASRSVSLRSVKARQKGKVVIVSGRVGKAGSSPALAAEVVFRRHGKVVARNGGTLRGRAARAGSFMLPIRMARVPKGAKGRVTVTLADEAATSAGARRTASVRR
jgi:hypothetical protein